MAADLASERLVAALVQKEHRLIHLCPLDLADAEFPPLDFGPCSVRGFTEDELSDLFDAKALARRFPTARLDLQRFAEFTWLCVHEVVHVDGEPGQQAAHSWMDALCPPSPQRIGSVPEASPGA